MISDLSIHSSFNVAGLPERFARIPLEQLAYEMYAGPLRDLAIRYAVTLDQSRELPFEAPLFLGRAGTGKSYAAAVLVRLGHQRTGRAAWINCGVDLQFTNEFVSRYLPLVCRYP